MIRLQLQPRPNGQRLRQQRFWTHRRSQAARIQKRRSLCGEPATGFDIDELLQRLGKCGVINGDDEAEPKVKAYAYEHGSFSGEGPVVFFKEDSVTSALNLRSDE